MVVPMWNGGGLSGGWEGMQGLTMFLAGNIKRTSGTKAAFPSFNVINGANGAVGKTESDFMFTILATLIFSGAFFLALATIAWMFAHYHEKMIAALRFEPIPQTAPVYQLRISRRRVGEAPRVNAVCGSVLAA